MSKLKRIADSMMHRAMILRDINATEPLEQPLGGGILLRMFANEFEFSLLVMRYGVLPSETEMKVFRNVFEVIDATEKTGIVTKEGPHKGYHYYWLVWQIHPLQGELFNKNEPAPA